MSNLNRDIKCIAYFAAISQGKLLLMKRNKTPRKGYYSFVGGHAHENELLINALKREVQEEIGCRIESLKVDFVRVSGKDNANTPDDFFFDTTFLDDNIKGHKIMISKIDLLEVSAVKDNDTIYNLFIGTISGTPMISDEVKEVRWEFPEVWLDMFRTGEIKIQPIDFLLLSLILRRRLING